MPESRTFRFQVLLNGQPVCVAGVADDSGAMAVITDWKMRPKYDEFPGDVEFSVNASTGNSPNPRLYGWVRQALSPGDELTIRVLGPGDFDEAPLHKP